MKAATIKDIQTELENLPEQELMSICLRLARFKKENKELLTYLLFESFDEQAYLKNVKQYVNGLFAEMNSSNLYFVKKTLRKILRLISKFSRYTGSANVEIQLLMHFCMSIKSSGIKYTNSPVLTNLFNNQVKKIKKSVAALHEDLQYDYDKELKKITGT